MDSKLAKKIWGSSFIRNVAVVAGGEAGSQAILIAFTPLITRLYGPEAYGYQGVFITIATLLVPLAALAYPIAIVLAKSDADAFALARLSALTSIITSCLVALFVFFFGSQLSEIFNLKEVAKFLWLVPLYLFFSGILQIVNQWRIRKKQFAATANISIINSFLFSSIKVGFGLFTPKGATLIIISTFGVALQSALMLLSMKDIKLFKAMVTGDGMNNKTTIDTARKYSDFPKYRAPQDFLNALTQGLPLLMLSSLFSPAAAGCFSLAKSVLMLPASLLAKAVGDVFYPKLSEAYNAGHPVAPQIIKATALLAAVGIVPFGIVMVAGTYLFSYAFGKEWAAAGQYSQWLSLWLYFMFINRPANLSLPVLGLLKQSMAFEIISTVTRIIAILIGFLILNNDVYSIALFSIAGMMLNVALIIYAVISAKNHDNKMLTARS